MSLRYGILAIVASLAVCAGCLDRTAFIVGSGVIVGESYDLTDFDRVTVSGAMDVTVLQGDGFAVEVSADDNVLPFVDIVQRDNELRIGWSKPISLQRASIICVVHMPQLSEASVNGASKLHLKSLAAEQLQLEASGASRIDGDVTSGDLRLQVSGASNAKLSGQAQTVAASVSGASTAQLDEMIALQTATVEASGASTVHVHTAGELSMEASGASKVLYSGNPQITRSEAHGASSIRQAK